MKRRILLLGILIAVMLFACAPKVVPGEKPTLEPVTQETQTTGKEAWEVEWDNLIKAAKREGRLTIYSGLERDTTIALRKHFGEKYGLTMDIVSAKGDELAVKVNTERRAGLFLPDVYVEGPGQPLEWKYKGIIMPLDKVIFRPDVLDKKLWWHGYGPFFDQEHFTAGSTRSVQQPVIINTKMVRPGELTSYNDLLEPRWKGKILLGDPTVGGGAQYTMFSTLAIMGEEYIRKLALQVGPMTRDKRLVVEWVAREKYPLAFGAGTSIVLEFIKEGAKVDMVSFKEGAGTTSTGLVALFDRTPNPYAAKLFINWFLTKEGQEAYSIGGGKMSRRLDVSEDHLLPVQRMREGAKYVVIDEEFLRGREKLEMTIGKYYKR